MDQPELSAKPVKPVKSTYYRSLPTASGLKLDQTAVNTLVEMGFDKAYAIQGMFFIIIVISFVKKIFNSG